LALTGFPGFTFLLHSTCGAERLPDEVERKETGSDRSGAGAADPPSRAAPSLAILGADALLAAQPATAVQLAHACSRIGYHAVVPASWGDELIAGGCLRHIASRRGSGDTGPAIFCACPYVAHRLLAVGPDLEPFLASFVAPPVAVARYLRTLYTPTRIRLTYVGRCPGAADDAIDARLTPEELLAVLAERGVDLLDQPRVFDSVIPPDRRRFLSQPGGLPAAEMLRRVDPDRREVEVTGPELASELAQILLSKANVLIDVATRLGCACSGAVVNVPPEAARAGVAILEPPRASSPIVDERVPVPIELPLPAVSRDPIDVVPAVASRRSSGAARVVSAESSPASSAEPPADPAGAQGGRRRSPTQGVTVRPHAGAVPTTRSGEGRALPRAYVARRNTGSRGRGPSTPPRGEPRRLDASGSGAAAGTGRAGNGASPRGGGVSPRADRIETPPPPAPGEVPMRAKEPIVVAAAVGAAPDRADDPHGDGFAVVAETSVAEQAVSDAALEPTSDAEPRRLSPISTVTVSRAAAFRTRTMALARFAVASARRRRTMLAALLGVALLSASVGILAGRWLAARTAATPGATR
jgi:iron only hydrogenase large subunit